MPNFGSDKNSAKPVQDSRGMTDAVLVFCFVERQQVLQQPLGFGNPICAADIFHQSRTRFLERITTKIFVGTPAKNASATRSSGSTSSEEDDQICSTAT